MKTNVLRQYLMGLGVISLVILPGCDRGADDAVWWRAEHERIGLSHRLELKRFQLQKIEPVMELAEATKAIKAAAAMENRVDGLRRQKAELAGELDGLASKLESTRRDFLIGQRRLSTGLAFEEFRIPSGRVFASATVADIDDSGVTLRHSDGSARLRFKDLSPAQRELFGLEQVSSQAAERKENTEALAYERWIDRQLAITRIQEMEKAEKQGLAKEREAKILAAANARTARASPPVEEFSSESRVRHRTDRPRRSNFTTYHYVAPSIRYRPAAAFQRDRSTPGIGIIFPGTVNTPSCYAP